MSKELAKFTKNVTRVDSTKFNNSSTTSLPSKQGRSDTSPNRQRRGNHLCRIILLLASLRLQVKLSTANWQIYSMNVSHRAKYQRPGMKRSQSSISRTVIQKTLPIIELSACSTCSKTIFENHYKQNNQSTG